MHLDQAKVETLRLPYFRLGPDSYRDDNDKEVKALTLIAIAAGSLFNLIIVLIGFHAFVSLKICLLFFGKKVKAIARLEGSKG